MHGHMIEFNGQSNSWTWSRWDYGRVNGMKQVVRHTGQLQFQKIFRNVVEDTNERVHARSGEEIEKSLKKKGVDYIFLFQGRTVVEEKFKTVEEAVKHHRLDRCPQWDLTDYWFGFDNQLNSWAMYDAFTGSLQFTPQARMKTLSNGSSQPATRTRRYSQQTGIYREAGNTVH